MSVFLRLEHLEGPLVEFGDSVLKDFIVGETRVGTLLVIRRHSYRTRTVPLRVEGRRRAYLAEGLVQAKKEAEMPVGGRVKEGGGQLLALYGTRQAGEIELVQ